MNPAKATVHTQTGISSPARDVIPDASAATAKRPTAAPQLIRRYTHLQSCGGNPRSEEPHGIESTLRRDRRVSTYTPRTVTSVRRTTSAGIDYVKSLWARREFAWYMAMGNLKSRNASTALGLLWWILNPLLQGAVYFVVFGLILNVSRDLGYLLAGVFVFYFTSTSMTSGANSIVQNRQLLVNPAIPSPHHADKPPSSRRASVSSFRYRRST